MTILVKLLKHKFPPSSALIIILQGCQQPTLTRKNSLNKSPVPHHKLNKTSSMTFTKQTSPTDMKSINNLNEKAAERILPQINIDECRPRYSPRLSVFNRLEMILEPTGCLKEKDDYSLYIFAPNNR